MAISLSALTENFIVMLSYSDKHSVTVRNLVPPEFYGGPYRTLAARIYEFIDRYKKPPKDHIADLMSDKIDEKANPREAELYKDILLGIADQKGSLNEEYVMGQLSNFVKRQSLRSIAIDLAKLLQRDTDESLEEADLLISTSNHQVATVFEPGLRLSNKDRVLDFLDQQHSCFPTGIPELDKRGFGPTRKELWLYVAAAKRGKTWMLIQLAKMAMVHRLKVCHITLEMSEERCAGRYMQALFAMSKRNEQTSVTKFERDQLGRMTGFEEHDMKPKLWMEDPKIAEKLTRRINKFGPRMLDNVIVKQFPTGHLTMRQLEAYLDALESNERFTPDLMILDYPDLMKLDKNNLRLSIDEIYKELRGLGITRNMAVAVVTQSHRAAAKSKHVGGENVAEAYSKVAHADCIITYQQTDAEKKMGLARLFVAGGRNDEDQITLAISQNYAMGIFAVDSIMMAGANYWPNLPQISRDGEDLSDA